ncbi:uncharacterized protein RAG0_03014 [Rhynchosporium agropyri]|uniref:Uncharacterized protein n=1 Tax=Rhynchosporium agropyri TaxID=914238 RepID=A0A1E1K316_9HELO|nr:uncharacterized protein RAG0_03014 [Rhynchosporium agropyri]
MDSVFKDHLTDLEPPMTSQMRKGTMPGNRAKIRSAISVTVAKFAQRRSILPEDKIEVEKVLRQFASYLMSQERKLGIDADAIARPAKRRATGNPSEPNAKIQSGFSQGEEKVSQGHNDENGYKWRKTTSLGAPLAEMTEILLPNQYPTLARSNESRYGRSATNTILSNQRKHDRIIWFPWKRATTGEESIRDNATLSVTLEVVPAEVIITLPWFKLNDFEVFRNKFGKGFIEADSEESLVVIHQALVVMQFFREDCPCDVDFWTWADIAKLVKGAKKHRSDIESLSRKLAYNHGNDPSNGLVFFHWNRPESVIPAELHKVYDLFTSLERGGASIRCIPNRTEAFQTLFKLRDIIALDEIAHLNNEYRPVTCYPNGRCRLIEQLTVHKRSQSCGGHHVLRTPKEDRKDLSCYLDTPEKLILSDTEEGIWFHQEFVDTYKSIGEFRVFITTFEDVDGLRGRKGKVEWIGHTRASAVDPENIISIAAELSDIFASCKPLTALQLRLFSERIFEQLRARQDWDTSFESLEVGVRLDVVVSPTLQSFFVGEITRIWCADFLSDMILPQPSYYLCRKVANSMKSFLLN